MKINDDHLFHGAALTQIAEDPKFTAINAFSFNGKPSRSSFRINGDIGVYLKYATEPKGSYDEYIFTFLGPHLDELDELEQAGNRVFVALICVKARQICGLTHTNLRDLIAKRTKAFGGREDQYTVLVTIPAGKAFRVYVNSPGKKGKSLGETKVPRNNFPSLLFK